MLALFLILLLLVENFSYLLNLVAKMKMNQSAVIEHGTLSEGKPTLPTDSESRIIAKMQVFEWTSITGS